MQSQLAEFIEKGDNVNIFNFLSSPNLADEQVPVELLAAILLIDTADSNLLDLTCKLILQALANTGYASVHSMYLDLILRGLEAASPQVLALVLNILEKCVDSKKKIELVLQTPQITEKVISLVSLNDSGVEALALVASHASHLIAKLAYQPENLELLLQYSSAFSKLLDSKSEIVRFRTYSMFADIAAVSPQHVAALDAHHYLNFMVGIPSNDLLAALNAIDLYTNFAQTESGLALLQAKGIMQHMYTLLVSSVEESGELVICACIKFWGLVMFYQPHQINCLFTQFSVFSGMEMQLQEASSTVRDQVLVSVSNIGSSTQGLASLIEQETLLQKVLSVGKYSSGESRTGFYITVANLIDHPASSDIDLEQATLDIFESISTSDAVTDLMTNAKSALPDLCIAAYSVILAAVRYDWCLKKICTNKGFAQFLLEKHPKTPRAVLQIKHQIATRICSREGREIIVDNNGEAKWIDAFVRNVEQGAFAASNQAPVVATQSM